jgi:hypothetical protein
MSKKNNTVEGTMQHTVDSSNQQSYWYCNCEIPAGNCWPEDIEKCHRCGAESVKNSDQNKEES